MLNAGSECNPSMLTFDGVDVMGNRLAEEVSIDFAVASPFPLIYQRCSSVPTVCNSLN